MNSRNIQNTRSVPEIHEENLDKSRIPISTPAPGGLPNYLGIAWRNLVKFIGKRLLRFETGDPSAADPSEIQLRFDPQNGVLRGFDGTDWHTLARRAPESHSITADHLAIPSTMVGEVILDETLPRRAVHVTPNSIRLDINASGPISGVILYFSDIPILTQRVDTYTVNGETTTFHGPVFKETDDMELGQEVRIQCLKHQNISVTLNVLEHEKLRDIEENATDDQTADEIIALLVAQIENKLPITAIAGGITEAERAKLADIEDGATADLTGEEIVAILAALDTTAKLPATAVEGAFTPEEREKLATVASNATPDPTGDHIVEILQNTGRQIPAGILEGIITDEERAKLAGIADGATPPLTGPEIVRRLVNLSPEDGLHARFVIDTITQGEREKLAGIQDGATRDMTGETIIRHIREAKHGLTIDDIENAITPAERLKLKQIEPKATADLTAPEIVALLESLESEQLRSHALQWLAATVPNASIVIPPTMTGRVDLDQKYDLHDSMNQANRIAKLSDTEIHIAAAHPDYKLLFGDEHAKRVDALVIYGTTGTALGDQLAVMRVDTLEDVKFSWGMHLVLKGQLFTGADNPNTDTDISYTGTQVGVKFLRRVDIREEFSDAERQKLASVDPGATDDQTGHEIIERLEKVPADQRLSANAVRGTITDPERQKLADIPADATGPPTEDEILAILQSLHQQQKLPGQQ